MKQPHDYHFLLGSAGVHLSWSPAAGRLSFIKLWGFCSAFPITSSTVSLWEHRSTLQYLPAVRLKWWGWWSYLLSGSLQSNGRPLHSHLLNTDEWGKSSVHWEAACTKKCSRRSCSNLLHTDSSEWLIAPLAGYVWLVLSNFLGHTRSCGKNQKTEMKQWIK